MAHSVFPKNAVHPSENGFEVEEFLSKYITRNGCAPVRVRVAQSVGR
jgi:hypothetical protein